MERTGSPGDTQSWPRELGDLCTTHVGRGEKVRARLEVCSTRYGNVLSTRGSNGAWYGYIYRNSVGLNLNLSGAQKKMEMERGDPSTRKSWQSEGITSQDFNLDWVDPRRFRHCIGYPMVIHERNHGSA